MDPQGQSSNQPNPSTPPTKPTTSKPPWYHRYLAQLYWFQMLQSCSKGPLPKRTLNMMTDLQSGSATNNNNANNELKDVSTPNQHLKSWQSWIHQVNKYSLNLFNWKFILNSQTRVHGAACYDRESTITTQDQCCLTLYIGSFLDGGSCHHKFCLEY